MDIGSIEETMLIFGGPYSNLQATLAMKRTAEHLIIKPQNIVCTGDLVAYCGEPESTVGLIREWGIHVVMGNCEESLSSDAEDCGCGFEEGTVCSILSRSWYDFAKKTLSVDNKKWMRALPRAIKFKSSGLSFRCVHGSASHINQFIFASTDAQIKAEQLALTNTDVMIGGHCGLPFGHKIDRKAWLNAGVIGMPANEGLASVWYMLLKPSLSGVEASWHRLEYDFAAAQTIMHRERLNEHYSRALTSGLWPSLDILPEQERILTGQKINIAPLKINQTH